MKYSSEAAYLILGCDEAQPDEDIVVTWYSRTPFKLGALRAIAGARQSRFLFFVLSIHQHLNDTNVAILAKKTPFTDSEDLLGAEHQDLDSSPVQKDSSSGSEISLDEYGEVNAISEASDQGLKSPCSESYIASSAEDMDMDSDFEEESGGAYFDGKSWHCEECSYEFVDGKCPCGGELRRCESCNCQCTSQLCFECSKKCDACGGETVDGVCENCTGDEESNDDKVIEYDLKDSVWRCTDCQWEVEADNGVDGNCHCLNERGEARYLDLSECIDYEPADSCSSQDDSASDEPDSLDESAIDDEEERSDLDETSGPTGNDTATIAEQDPEQDKENPPPNPSSDDVQLVDRPDGRETVISLVSSPSLSEQTIA